MTNQNCLDTAPMTDRVAVMETVSKDVCLQCIQAVVSIVMYDDVKLPGNHNKMHFYPHRTADKVGTVEMSPLT